MVVSFNIVPHSSSIHMFGSTQTSTAYSLTGDLIATLPSPCPSFFDPRPRPFTLYITSVSIVFDGKAEIVSSQQEYAGSRVCLVEKELIPPGRPLPITSEICGGPSKRFGILFDLAIPGWLPPTTSTIDQTCIAYSLYARVRYVLDDGTLASSTVKTAGQISPLLARDPSSWPLSLFGCLPTFSNPRAKTIAVSPVPMNLTRFRKPPSTAQRLFDTAEDLTHPRPGLFPPALGEAATGVVQEESTSSTSIPMDVLDSVEVMMSAPRFVGVMEGTIPVSLRIRIKPEDDLDGLVLDTFDVEVTQLETYRFTPCSRFMSSFPVPPPNVQPPSLPLISQNPAAAALALGLAPPPTTTQSTRRFPLIPNIRVPFRPSLGGLALDTEWAKMDMVIPLLKPSSRADKALDDGDVAQEDDTAISTNTRRERETRRRALRPELDCQLFKIKHEVRIALHCSYEDPQASSSAMADSPPRKKQTLYATLPVRFADILPRDLPVPPSPPPSATSTLAPSIFSSSFPSLVTSSPPTPLSSLLFFDLPYGDSIVPAYTELFYENGERRDDDFDSEWLPVYEPRRMDGKDTPCGCHEDDESPA